VIQAGVEDCDDGNGVDSDACRNTCVAAACGDGVVQAGVEDCDDGNGVDSDACRNTCVAAACGDGVVQAGVEDCDDGNGVDTDACRNTCVAAACGDGVVQAGVEDCDDGNGVDTDACRNTCVAAACGDGVIQAGVEDCDDGNGVDSDACRNTCVAAACGDGVVQAGVEDCDDGNGVDSDACRNTCVAAACGDGVVQAGVEDCDDVGESATCNANCTAASCGDGLVNASAGEACDDAGESPTCNSDCTVVSCGDGVVNESAGEACDGGGETAGCNADCTPAQCGDETVNASAGEACEDGNAIDTDACTNTCQLASCGDGIVWAGNEDCDSAGESGTCDVDCSFASCGDGQVNGTAGETCDDSGESSVCDADCTPAACGDAVINPSAGELCDDGNALGDDACLPSCIPAACGDSFLWAGVEQCDDANLTNGDGCDAGTCVESAAGRLTAGGAHTCGFFEPTKLRCWGTGDSGRLGYDGIANVGQSTSPAIELQGAYVPIPSVESVVQVDAGGTHTCAIVEENFTRAVRCWGRGDQGQLGYGNPLNVGDGEVSIAAAGVVDLGEPIAQVATGDEHTCALAENTGNVYCWGNPTFGRLGYGDETPVGLTVLPKDAGPVPIGEPAIQIAAGGAHTCALLASRTVKCWGLGLYGQLGLASTENIGDPVTGVPQDYPPVEIGEEVVHIAAGGGHSCAVGGNGDLYCWGGDDGSGVGPVGQLGRGSTELIGDDERPIDRGPLFTGVQVAYVAAGARVTCIVDVDGDVRCFGDNEAGQLAIGSNQSYGDDAGEFVDQLPPIPLPNKASYVDVGGTHVCARLTPANAAGDVVCWGASANGRLGYGDTGNVGGQGDPTPADVGLVDYQ
jgi:cysteine-rich repeat protein